MSQASLLDDFDPAEVAAAIAGRINDLATIGASRSIRTSNNRKTRRVESDETLAALVNTNRRLEQSVIHNSAPLFDFYREAFDGIRRRRHTAAA